MCCVLGTKEISKWRQVKNGKKSTYNTTQQDLIIYQKSNVQTLNTNTSYYYAAGWPNYSNVSQHSWCSVQ